MNELNRLEAAAEKVEHQIDKVKDDLQKLKKIRHTLRKAVKREIKRLTR